jgi:uncharacterized protein (TIGR02646 family)
VRQIHKPANGPEILTQRGPVKVAEHQQAIEQGQTEIAFDRRIYAASEVKQALMLAQQNKCCFCEARILDEGDVEHFRPKAGVRQGAGEPLLRPGYYWLAYDWDNLFWSCSYCNTRHKGNLFPLANPHERVRAPDTPLNNEQPLFLHPCHDSPEYHIRFEEWVPVGNNERGEETIRALGLDSPRLLDRRREKWKTMQDLVEAIPVVAKKPVSPEQARVLQKLCGSFTEFLSDAAEFSTMIQAAVPEPGRSTLLALCASVLATKPS